MFLDPYAVDGATITGAQLRQQAYAVAKGETGVLTPTALKVVAVSGSPGLAGIQPGGALISVSSRGEAYQVTNTAMDGDAVLEVPPAGSSGATSFVIVEVTDPQFHGQEAGVEPRLVSSLSGLTRPYIALARIRQAAGAGFDATTPVDDLRDIAVPRIERRLFAHNLEGSSIYALTSTNETHWPNLNTGWSVDIPWWATHAQIIGTWGGVRVSRSNANGTIWVRIGSQSNHIRTQDQMFDLDLSGMPDMSVRESWTAADDIRVPAQLRGTTQPARLMGRRLGSASAGPPRLDNASSILIDVQFTEGPA